MAAALAADFEAQGFVAIQGVLSPAQVERARACLEVDRRSRPESWQLYGRSRDVESVRLGESHRFKVLRQSECNLFSNYPKNGKCGKCGIGYICQDPMCIQHHLRKLFEGVSHLPHVPLYLYKTHLLLSHPFTLIQARATLSACTCVCVCVRK
jgi:hypothetical protein